MNINSNEDIAPDENEKRIKELYESGRHKELKPLLDEVINSPTASLGSELNRYLRARAFEQGGFGEVDLSAALEDYRFLYSHKAHYENLGAMGMARVLLAMDKVSNADEAIRLYEEAVEFEPKATDALMMLGKLNEEQKKDFATAGRYYLRAYFSGMPWGLRYYARLQSKRGRPLRATVCHVLCSITSPFFVMRHGVRRPFE